MKKCYKYLSMSMIFTSLGIVFFMFNSQTLIVSARHGYLSGGLNNDNSYVSGASPGAINYEQNTYFADSDSGFSSGNSKFGKVEHFQGKNGQDLVFLGGDSNHVFEYKSKLDEAGYTKSGFRFSAISKQQNTSGIFRTNASGNKLTANQINEYANHGSNSYWNMHHVYYPGTKGYFSHSGYYADEDHFDYDQQTIADNNVVNDNLNILKPTTESLFVNQEIAYENSEVQPHIFVYTEIAKNVNTFQQYADISYENLQSNVNRGPLLVVMVFKQTNGLYSISIIPEGQMKQYFQQSELDSLVKVATDDNGLPDVTSVNKVLGGLDKQLTILVWQKYIAPNLTNVNQYNQGKKVSPNESPTFKKEQEFLAKQQAKQQAKYDQQVQQRNKVKSHNAWIFNGFLLGFLLMVAYIWHLYLNRN